MSNAKIKTQNAKADTADADGATPPPTVQNIQPGPPTVQAGLPMAPKRTPLKVRFPRRHELRSFFGELKINRGTGLPDDSWVGFFMQRMPVVYPLRLSVAPEITLSHVTVHRELAASLRSVFQDILKNLGGLEAVRKARADLLGEAYAFRAEEGGHRLSLHAYGAAITIDPERNPYGKPWDADGGMIHPVVIEAFKHHGWQWGGDRKENQYCALFEARGI